VSDNLAIQATLTSANVAKVDTTALGAPTAVNVTSGGPVWGASTCGVTSGTRYINAAGQGSVSISATIAAAEAGESVVFSASSGGSPVTATVAAAPNATSVTTTVPLNLTSLGSGTLTISARTQDAAGNQSATVAPANAIIKDVVAATPTDAAYRDNISLLGGKDEIFGTYECGATIVAVKTVGGSTTYTSPIVGAGGTYSFDVSAQALSAYSYNVTATDRADNTSTIVVVSGIAAL